MTRSHSVLTCALALSALAIAPLAAQGERQTPPPPAADSGSKAVAQPPPPTPAAPAPASPTGLKNVQVEVSVKLEGGGTPITKQMTLVGADGSVSMGRAGMDVPVAIGPANQYRSVGLNVDARPRLIEGGRIGLNLKLEVSAVVKAEGSASSTPSFNSSKTELNLVLDNGKPLVIARAVDAEVGRGYTVEVKATILR